MKVPDRRITAHFGVIPLRTAQELFNRDGELDQVDILTTNPNPTRDELDAIKNNLQVRMGNDISVTYPSSQGERMTQMLQNYQIGLNFMSGIALFVGAFLIYNAFAMTVVERTREFGMLRTIGMTRGQVTGLVMLEAGVLGIIGSWWGGSWDAVGARIDAVNGGYPKSAAYYGKCACQRYDRPAGRSGYSSHFWRQVSRPGRRDVSRLWKHYASVANQLRVGSCVRAGNWVWHCW